MNLIYNVRNGHWCFDYFGMYLGNGSYVDARQIADTFGYKGVTITVDHP